MTVILVGKMFVSEFGNYFVEMTSGVETVTAHMASNHWMKHVVAAAAAVTINAAAVAASL